MKLSFDYLYEKILKFKASGEYIQASIVILREIFKEAEKEDQPEPDHFDTIVSELKRLKEDGHVFMHDEYIPQFAEYIAEAIKNKVK